MGAEMQWSGEIVAVGEEEKDRSWEIPLMSIEGTLVLRVSSHYRSLSAVLAFSPVSE